MTNKKKIVIVAFSGGKDSLASLIWAIKKYGADNIVVVFCDTGWEHPLTYDHINEIMTHFGLEIKVISSEKYNGFLDMVAKKGRFPSTRARFCTEQLKTIPMINYILDEHQGHFIQIQGIRAAESNSRAQLSDECRFFKYYFEPYTSNELTIKNLAKRENLTDIQLKKLNKAISRLAKGKNNERYHTYRKAEVLEYCKKYSDDIMRPVFHKTAHEVIQVILDAGLKPNPLYYMGLSRVGCFPCIMVNKSELWVIIERESWVLDKLRQYESKTGQGFFAPDYIPDRYCSKTAINKKGQSVKYPTIDDVVRYLKDKNAQGELFDEAPDENHSCMSYYNICE